ncbi:MAG: NAD(P)H-hydrate dehydratase [Ilumatobacteraceae bacterium]
MLGGRYGKRVVVLAGQGNNGADGKAAASSPPARGVHVTVFDAPFPPALPPSDLVIDAAYGTGFRGEFHAPDPNGAPVLAVDIPSGVDGLTGHAGAGVLPADRTVTFAAYKPGLLFPPGSVLAGEIEVADIGLPTPSYAHLVEAVDVAGWLPYRTADSHKWRTATWIVAGSATMPGAARLAASAAQRTGSGMVRHSAPGVGHDPMLPTEVVTKLLPQTGWAREVLDDLDRFHSVVIGPGLGRADTTAASVRDVVTRCPLPMVVDADGLFALAWSSEGAASVLRARTAQTVLTPHDGEYSLLMGSRVGSDRVVAARRLADQTRSVVLLKGAATVVAAPNGGVLVVDTGDERLATAGTGDVLSGIVGSLLAQGMDAWPAAAAGAWIHGMAARRGPERGLVASDLPPLIPAVLADLDLLAD